MKSESERPNEIEVEIDPDLEELIPNYMANRRRDVNALQETISRIDFESIGRLGHTMKGSGGGYGFDYITAVGAKLETAAKNSSLDDIKTLVTELSDYLDRVRVIYR